MKILIQKLTTLVCAAIAFATMQSLAQAANLLDQDKKFLTSYEKIHVALAADDLASAKAAATELGDSGSDIAKANSLKDARTGFEKLSARAKTTAAVKAAITSPTARCLTKIGCKHRRRSPIPMAAKGWSGAEKSKNNMKNKTRRIVPFFAAFTLITAADAFAHNPNGKADPMNASLEALKGAEFEQSFLQQMIQHHRSGRS